MIAPSASLLYGLCGAALIGLGLYGFVVHRRLIRRVLAFNVIGSGIFLLFGASSYRDPAAGADPVPQAMIITGIVVALSATALALALIVAYARLAQSGALPEDEAPGADDEDRP